MKINIYGLGYVGCVSAACLGKNGFHVTGIDMEKIKVDAINQGKSPIIEPGLEEAIKEAVSFGKLRAARETNGWADLSIVCVGTPSRGNGSLQLGYIERVSTQLGKYLRKHKRYHVINIRSTVLPGTVGEVIIPILEETSGRKAGKDFGVTMNPEFMREGTSLHDYFNPPFTVIGQIDRRSGDVVERLYRDIPSPLIRTGVKTAEMIKYVCNTFHALKITFANEIGNLCKTLDIDSHEVMDIFSRDKKLNISPAYLKPGFAFGGSCLPKDLRALLYKSKQLDLELPLLANIIRSNRNQIEVAYDLIVKTRLRKVGLLGLSFKTETDDLRESPMVELAEKLIGKGYDLSIYDREVSLARVFGSNKRYINKVIPHLSTLMSESISDVIKRSDVIVVAKSSEEIEKSISRLNGGKKVIDLARLKSLQGRNGRFSEGICW